MYRMKQYRPQITMMNKLIYKEIDPNSQFVLCLGNHTIDMS